MPSRRAVLAAPALLALPATRAAAQDGFPSRTVRIIVSVPAGGPADLHTRLVAQRLGERLGQAVIVENRPGANSIIGTQAALAQPADGHTVLSSPSGPIAINPHLYGARLPYDPFRDLAFVTLVSVLPLVLVANNTLPANNLREFLALTQRMGDRFIHASGTIGSPSHLAMAMALGMGGGAVTHVPFAGSAPAMTAKIAGQVMAGWDAAVAAAPFVRDGRLKALAVAHTERLPLLPDVPTAAEQGYPDLVAATWLGFVVPAATPAERVRRLATETEAILRAPDLRATMTGQGAIPGGGTPEEFLAFARAESEKWGRLVRQTGATAD